MTPIAILKDATRKVPQLKFAWGIVGVAAAGALIIALIGETRASIITLGGTFMSMVMLYIFSSLVSPPNVRRIPLQGYILMYSVLSFFCVFLMLTITAFIVCKPRAWVDFISVKCPAPPLPPIRFLSEKKIDIPLGPGGTRGFSFTLGHDGPLSVTLTDIVPESGIPPNLFIRICSSDESCPEGFQRAMGESLSRHLPAGIANVSIHNFENSKSVVFSSDFKYPE